MWSDPEDLGQFFQRTVKPAVPLTYYVHVSLFHLNQTPALHFLSSKNMILKHISLNKRNYIHDVLWMSDPNKHRCLL